MKARIRKTGEIVDIVCYSGTTYRVTGDTVSYIDSKGVEHDRENLNYYWDFETVDESREPNWDVLRGQAAISATQGVLSNTLLIKQLQDTAEKAGIEIDEALVKFSIEVADSLIKELRTA